MAKDAEKNSPLLPKRRRAMHLGFSPKNSAWLLGYYENGALHVYETRAATFVEDILVRDVTRLNFPDPPVIEQLLDKVVAGDKNSLAVGDAKASVGAIDQYGVQGLHFEEWVEREAKPSGSQRVIDCVDLRICVPEKDLTAGANEEGYDESSTHDARQPGIRVGSSPTADGSHELVGRNVDTAPNGSHELVSENVEKEAIASGRQDRAGGPPEELAAQDVVDVDTGRSGEVSQKLDPTRAQPLEILPIGENDAEDEVTYGPPTRRRGRPKGAKDKKKRNRKTKAQMRSGDEAKNALVGLISEKERAQDDVNAHLNFDEAKDEIHEIDRAEVFLVREIKASKPGDAVKPRIAFDPRNPERPKWIEAKTIEKVRLEAYKTWRRLTKEEEEEWRAGKLQAVPCALLLNRKRCGRFKGRLVVLGNRWNPGDKENAVYASVVSQVGNRATAVQIARRGFHPIPFDISNALVRASM
ncbi:MAG: hypothetical protein QF637_08500, partial [Acidimicrobiales bacterium]|nr:hypothetical protein [Acidimicrobiales bacterium]